MSYSKPHAALACFGMAIGLVYAAQQNNTHVNTESTNPMSLKTNTETKPLTWLNYALQATSPATGQFTAQDKSGRAVVLAWTRTHLDRPEFAATMKTVSELACRAYTPVELAFLKKYPEAVLQDDAFKHPYYQQLRTVFTSGVDTIDWTKAQEAIESFLQRLHHVDLSAIGADTLKLLANDLFIFVMAKDQETGALLGFARFAITPAHPYGDVKIIGIEIEPSMHNRGLAKLLASTIFKIVPKTERLFLGTRVTNETARKTYEAWGFTLDCNPVQHGSHVFNPKHWTLLEYKTQQAHTLQTIAETLRITS